LGIDEARGEVPDEVIREEGKFGTKFGREFQVRVQSSGMGKPPIPTTGGRPFIPPLRSLRPLRFKSLFSGFTPADNGTSKLAPTKRIIEDEMDKVEKDRIRAVVREAMESGRAETAYEEICGLLASLGSEENADGAKRFIPGLGESFGVPLPTLRIIASEIDKWLKHHDHSLVLLRIMWGGGYRDARVITAKVLERLGKRRWQDTLDLAASFIPGIRNWEECDQIACFGLRYVVQRHPEAVFPLCRTWVSSREKWTRRFGVAVLTSLPKAKGYSAGAEEFAILTEVMDDPAREVQDAVAWALREMLERDQEPVFQFLITQASGAGKATRRIIKLAMKKLPVEKREVLRPDSGS